MQQRQRETEQIWGSILTKYRYLARRVVSVQISIAIPCLHYERTREIICEAIKESSRSKTDPAEESGEGEGEMESKNEERRVLGIDRRHFAQF